MSDQPQWKVVIAYQSGETQTFRHAVKIGFNEFGAMVIEQPKEHPRGRILVPFAIPGMYVKWAVIEEEVIQEVKAKLVLP